MSIIETSRHFAGKIFEYMYKLPLVGDWLVRTICRLSAGMTYYAPGTGMRKFDSIQEVRRELERVLDMAQVKIEVTKEEKDMFEFLVPACPYGYHRENKQGVCDAIMDLDRTLFKLCGAKLVVEEAIVDGAEKCRMTMHKI